MTQSKKTKYKVNYVFLTKVAQVIRFA